MCKTLEWFCEWSQRFSKLIKWNHIIKLSCILYSMNILPCSDSQVKKQQLSPSKMNILFSPTCWDTKGTTSRVDFLEKRLDLYVLNPLITKVWKITGQPQRCFLGHVKGFSLAEMHQPKPQLNLWTIVSSVLTFNCCNCPRQIYIIAWLQIYTWKAFKENSLLSVNISFHTSKPFPRPFIPNKNCFKNVYRTSCWGMQWDIHAHL